MKAEIRLKNNEWHIFITDVINQVTKDFGPFSIVEADALIHDTDKLRDMFLSA